MSGTMNQIFLVNPADRTRRGLIARVEAGYSGGRHCYGYDIVGKGELTINETEARIVVRIYRAYADGASPRAIVKALNAEGCLGLGAEHGRLRPSTAIAVRATASSAKNTRSVSAS